MANGILADGNLIELASTVLSTPTPLAPATPLDLCRRPTMAERLWTAPDTETLVIVCAYPQRETQDVVAAIRTNWQQAAEWRLELFADPDLTQPLWTGGGTVIPRLYDWRDVAWGADNWWRGNLPQRDVPLYPMPLYITHPRHRVGSWRLTVTDSRNPDGALALAYLWAGPGQPFALNYDWGHSQHYDPGDRRASTPGGWVRIDPGVARRSAQIPLSLVDARQRDLIADLRTRAGYRRPVLWLPDPADAALCWRYGFVGQLTDQTGPLVWREPGLYDAALSLEEIVT